MVKTIAQWVHPLELFAQLYHLSQFFSSGFQYDLISMDGCNTIKSCFYFPPGCKRSQDCDAIVTWRVDQSQNVIHLELGGKRSIPNKWFALGMSDDQVMVCFFLFFIKYFTLPNCPFFVLVTYTLCFP